jgi:hypothetical protein
LTEPAVVDFTACALGRVVADEAVAGHGRDHDLRAALGGVGVAGRREAGRRLDQPGQHRGFGEAHLARGFAKIALCRGLDPIGAGAEIDAVEVELEDLGLGEFALEPNRQHYLLQLAPDCALLREEQVLGELLGDGRAALRHTAPRDI